MSSPIEFPQVLYEYWHASEEELETAIVNGTFKGVTVSSLLKVYLDLLVKDSGQPENYNTPSSLKSIVIGKIIAELKSTDDLPATATSIAQNLDHITYQQLLSDVRLPYRILRTVLSLTPSKIQGDGDGPGVDQASTDIDEAILANEDYLRGRDTDDSYLVTLDDLCSILNISERGAIQPFHRDDFSTIGLPFEPRFSKWKNEPGIPPQIFTSDTEFTDAFNMKTFGLLRGLDWTHVFVTGELILATLTGLDMEADVIHLHLYGLNADGANSKVEEIYNVWLANLPAEHENGLVIKSPKSIGFFTDSTLPRIEIELKLFSSLTQGLLEWEHDSYAIGYNGSNLLMLPRSARAIETGYSIFTSRLWGCAFAGDFRHILMDFDCALGLRALPSYAKSLEEKLDDQLLEATLSVLPSLHCPSIGKGLGQIDGPTSKEFEDLAPHVDIINQGWFVVLQEAISQRLQIPIHRGGYHGYLTRRIRHQVHGPDLETVQAKQITTPLLMPYELEMHILGYLPQPLNNAYNAWYSNPTTDVHDPTKYDPSTARLPSLSSTGNESGNLKYWIISNASMWTGQDKVQNAIFEVLNCLCIWFMYAHSARFQPRTDSTACLLWLINYLRSTLTLSPRTCPSDDDRRRQGLPRLKEALLLRAFVRTLH